MAAHVALAALIRLFAVLLLAGTLGLAPLFKFKWAKLFRSGLFVKTLMWIPIFAGFVAVLYMNGWLRLVLAVSIVTLAYLELEPRYRKHPNQRSLLRWYFATFGFCALQIPTITLFFNHQQAVDFLVTVCLSSALSDVAAFFSGNYFGKHMLPKRLNDHKSWEGVAGQLFGALLGVVLLRAFGIAAITWLWLPIGIGTALGDLSNSYVKRRLKIKDWGQSIPGHGGYLDRFSSLFGGLALSAYALLLFG